MVDGIHAARRGAERKLPITISRARLDASLIRMGGRAVDCARLESVCSLTGTQGSNPCPSASSDNLLRVSNLSERYVGLLEFGYHVLI
jgi:hypothetical protein